MFSRFSAQTKKTNPKNSEAGHAKAHFAYALTNFTLAHNELIAYSSSLKLQEVVQKATNLAASVQQMSAMAQETSASTQQISTGMQIIKTGESENYEKMHTLAQLAKEADSALDNMVDNVNQLAEQLKDIDHLSQNVSEIADHTNLLSLNAAIEAAHAGEHGRGFSVVAEEVRGLADKTKVTVKEVITISNQMNTKATSSVEVVDNVKQTFERYITDTIDVAEIMHKNMRLVEESASAVDNIASAAQQQAATTESLAQISGDLAGSADFSDIIKTDARNLSETIDPYITLSENNHVLSILAFRLVEHADFLRNTIRTAGQGLKTVSHRECAFGKWYHDQYDQYKHLQEFLAIDEPHKYFHDIAAAISSQPSLDNVKKIVDASLNILNGFLELSQAVEY